jgi:hypothetical protein
MKRERHLNWIPPPACVVKSRLNRTLTLRGGIFDSTTGRSLAGHLDTTWDSSARMRSPTSEAGSNSGTPCGSARLSVASPARSQRSEPMRIERRWTIRAPVTRLVDRRP